MRRLCFSLIFAFCVSFLWAMPAKTNRLCNDFAGLFTRSQVTTLEQRLEAFSDSTSNQICVVTVTDLEGYDAADYAQRLGQNWGVGSQKNNGLVILLKPRNEHGGGKVYLATGYGTECVLTDVQCGQILDRYMMPRLQEGDYYGAVSDAVDVIMPIMQGEWNEPLEEDDTMEVVICMLVIILIVVIFGLLISHHQKNNGGQGRSSSRGGGPVIFMGPNMGSGRSSGGFGGGSSFGGFGGGSFGGGGAGRSF